MASTPDPSATFSRRALLTSATGAAALAACSATPELATSPTHGKDWLRDIGEAVGKSPLAPGSPAWDALWKVVREGYPARPIYLNPGSHALPSVLVTERIAALAKELAANPHHFNEHGEAYVREVLRPRLARLFGLSDASSISVGVNATQGNHAVALSVLCGQSGEALRCSTDHATTSAISRWLAGAGQITEKVAVLPRGEKATRGAFVSCYAEQVNSNTKLVIIPAVSYAEAHRLPVAEISAAIRARNPDVHIHVDAAHALGMLPINIESWGCDSAAFSGHKWAGGPEPTGALWISPEKRGKLQHPLISAGTDPYTAGTGGANLLYLRAFDAALEVYETLGPSRVWQRMLEQRALLSELLDQDSRLTRISTREAGLETAMISVLAPGANPGALAQAARGLTDTAVYKVLTDFGEPVLRFGVPVSSSPDEIRAGVRLALQTLT